MALVFTATNLRPSPAHLHEDDEVSDEWRTNSWLHYQDINTKGPNSETGIMEVTLYKP